MSSGLLYFLLFLPCILNKCVDCIWCKRRGLVLHNF